MNQMFLDSAEFVNIVNEVKINYPMVNKFSIGRVTQKNTKTNGHCKTIKKTIQKIQTVL
mgnify:CR=1 FL=1